MLPQNRELCRGVYGITLADGRFKTARLTAALFLPLQADTAEEYALLPRLLIRGCERYPDFTALHRRLNQLYGAEITGDVARIGETQALVLTAECTADRFALSGEALTAACAELLCDMLFRPVLDNGLFRLADVETERRCLAEEVRAQINEKQWYARRRAEQLLCPHEAYGIGRYGIAERIETLTPEAMTAAWRRALQQASVQLLIQDEAALPQVEAAFRNGFSAVEGRTPVPCATDTSVRLPQLRRETERMDVGQCKLVMGFRTACAEPDEQVAATRLMCALLGGTATSLLMRNVREKLSLCYYCSAQYDRLKGLMFVQSGVDEKNAARTETEILRQIETIRAGYFTDSELEDARRCMVQAFEAVNDSQPSVGAWYVSQGLASAPKTPGQTKQEIAAVTREQVIAAAQRITPECVYLLAPKEGSSHE
ncbi:MAG: insulinase family protein [Clostridia bacterium]|nr:insulinase family protein [Clostridia bacterium]